MTDELFVVLDNADDVIDTFAYIVKLDPVTGEHLLTSTRCPASIFWRAAVMDETYIYLVGYNTIFSGDRFVVYMYVDRETLSVWNFGPLLDAQFEDTSGAIALPGGLAILGHSGGSNYSLDLIQSPAGGSAAAIVDHMEWNPADDAETFPQAAGRGENAYVHYHTNEGRYVWRVDQREHTAIIAADVGIGTDDYDLTGPYYRKKDGKLYFIGFSFDLGRVAAGTASALFRVDPPFSSSAVPVAFGHLPTTAPGPGTYFQIPNRSQALIIEPYIFFVVLTTTFAGQPKLLRYNLDTGEYVLLGDFPDSRRVRQPVTPGAGRQAPKAGTLRPGRRRDVVRFEGH